MIFRMEGVTKFIDAIANLLGTLVWPGLVLFVLMRFRSSIGSFFETLSEFSFKGAGVEASLQRKQAEASAALIAATVARREDGMSPEITARDVEAAATAVEAITPRTLRRASKATVLWVDDRPNNNVRERRALEALGMDIVIATSTEDGLAKIQSQKFDVVISDMGRPPDPQAGYTLLERIRALGNSTPFVIYASSRAPEHVAEARRRGAVGCTNRPDELFDYVLTALGHERHDRSS
jgi:CheY-like chemotaxis protein